MPGRSSSSGRLIDRAARGAAGGMTRRDIVRMSVGAAVATSLPTVAWPTIAQSQTRSGNCPTPARGSCPPGLTPGRWKPGTKVAIPSGTPSTFNGCGAEGGFGGFDPVPDVAALADFFYGCKEHDCCYGTCGADKKACDDAFFADSLRACSEAHDDDDPIGWAMRINCNKAASFYRFGVSGKIGQGAWESAQESACFSCEECDADLLNDPANCGTCGHACAPGEKCNNGVCVGCTKPEVMCGTACCNTDTHFCEGGVCKQRCRTSETRCGTTCCASGDQCVDGVCRPPSKCPEDSEECGGICCKKGLCKNNTCGTRCGTGGPVCATNEDCCFPSPGSNDGFCCPPGSVCSTNISGQGKCI